MMTKIVNRFACLLLILTGATSAQAALSPIGIAILPPVQFPPEDFSIVGLRVSAIWGNHRNVYGFDVGAVGNMTSLDMVGVQASGVFNYNKGGATIIGLQVGGLANINVNKVRAFGLQVSAGMNQNRAESTVVGFQVAGIANDAKFTKICGAQIGLYNHAQEVYGFQIGLVNVTDSLHGIQIGLINFHHKGLFSVAPFLNIGF